MDEAGRGSWAGPVVAAAVILPRNIRLPGLNDSKKLSAKQRENLFSIIKESCAYGIGMASEKEVDEQGLLKATYLAFCRALTNLPQKADHLYIDGRDAFVFDRPHTSVIRGDQIYRCIAAASIIAKVTRDALMCEQAKNFPGYGFEIHKGYGTELHQKALHRLGPCELHRKTYKPLKELQCIQKSFLSSEIMEPETSEMTPF